MAGPRKAIAACGQVLKKLDFTSQPNYPDDPNLYTNYDALCNAVQNVQNLLTDPLATSGWCAPIQDVLLLANSNAYFSDTSPNPNQAQNAFVADWTQVKNQAGCP